MHVVGLIYETHTVYLFVLCGSQKDVICFIAGKQRVYYAVRTEFENIIKIKFRLNLGYI